MPQTQTTTEKVPYLKRLPAPDKIGDAVGILSSLLLQYFPGADGIEEFIHRKGELGEFFEEFCKRDNNRESILYRLRIKRFYHEVFDETIPLEQIMTPRVSVLRHLMYIRNIEPERLLKGIRKLLKVELQGGLEDTDIFLFKRNHAGYTIAYNGNTNHDDKLSLQEGQTLGGLIGREWKQGEWIGDSAMNCYEYILSATFKYWLIGKVYDNNGGFTLFTQILFGGKAIVAQSQGYNHYVFNVIDKGMEGPNISLGMRGIYTFLKTTPQNAGF